VVSDLLDRLSGFVELDQLVSIEVTSCRQNPVFVYDFTTLSSTYIADGIYVHNCRCRVLPVTSITDELEAEDRAAGVVRSGVEFVDDIPKQRPREPRAAYVRRMKDLGYSVTKTAGPSGERWYRKRTETRAESVPDWMSELAKRNSPADRLSLQEQLGGNRAGAQRAEYFRRQIQQGVSPQDALVNITRKVADSDLRTWRPVSELRRRDPSIGQAEPILSERQKKALARLRARDAAAGRSTGSRDPLSRIPAPRRGY